MTMIQNPVITGFNPDPSICRVGDDYYIATSTFEWFGGIQLHHSRDLVNWRLVGRALNSTEQLNMIGMDNSEGVYAPALSYADGKFWLTYSNVHSCRGGSWMATPCFVTTAESIEGPWSTPVPFGPASGFDPSLFHDDDGKKYCVNMVWDGRYMRNYFGGIILQAFNAETMQAEGPIHSIFEGTEHGCTEGPQILKKDGWYYLITAEGGTEYNHCVTVCRSRSITGPYELHPQNPLLTSRFQDNAELQRSGHGFFVQTQDGEWYLSHLATRPIADPDAYAYAPTYGNGRSILGRESCIQKITWRDGWPFLAHGDSTPRLNVPAPALEPQPWPKAPVRDHFESTHLAIDFQTLREPADESWCSLSEQPGKLVLKGRHYLYSRYQQSFVARRIQAFNVRCQTQLFFTPNSPYQMAGLVAYYARGAHYFLKLTANDAGEPMLALAQFIGDEYFDYRECEVAVSHAQCEAGIHLRVELVEGRYQFSYSFDESIWQSIGPQLNATPLSDEGGPDVFRFTGSFVGMFAADVWETGSKAAFDYFDYEERS